jgi:mannose-6-phosphate isomerase-like protein (cupin superfamily)
MKFPKLNSTINLVEKVWGTETWLKNDDDYCCKILELKKGFQCSVHMHALKCETFVVISGKVRMEVEGRAYEMVSGYSITINRNQKHRFIGLENSYIVECSTKHYEDDSYRQTESSQVDLSKFSEGGE